MLDAAYCNYSFSFIWTRSVFELGRHYNFYNLKVNQWQVNTCAELCLSFQTVLGTIFLQSVLASYWSLGSYILLQKFAFFRFLIDVCTRNESELVQKGIRLWTYVRWVSEWAELSPLYADRLCYQWTAPDSRRWLYNLLHRPSFRSPRYYGNFYRFLQKWQIWTNPHYLTYNEAT